MTYFYARVSTKEQSLERQLNEAAKYTIDEIYADKQSGKNFERVQYQAMKSVLKKGDTVIVKELDRLGRDKDMVKDEVRWYKDNGITLRITDLPTTMIDYGSQAWVGEMVFNIIIEVLASVAEQERRKTLQRQREGIDAMPLVGGKRVSLRTGHTYGTDPIPCPEFDKYYAMVKAGKISINKAMKKLNIGANKWYRLCKYKERDIEYQRKMKMGS